MEARKFGEKGLSKNDILKKVHPDKVTDPEQRKLLTDFFKYISQALDLVNKGINEWSFDNNSVVFCYLNTELNKLIVDQIDSINVQTRLGKPREFLTNVIEFLNTPLKVKEEKPQNRLIEDSSKSIKNDFLKLQNTYGFYWHNHKNADEVTTLICMLEVTRFVNSYLNVKNNVEGIDLNTFLENRKAQLLGGLFFTKLEGGTLVTMFQPISSGVAIKI